MKRWARDNGLSLALLALFLFSISGHLLMGWRTESQLVAEHGAAQISLVQYMTGPEFLSTMFENWESEFLQMWVFVMLTAYLFQRGSPESKDPDGPAAQDRDPKTDADKAGAPWPVRAGGVARNVYAHSLGLALFILFVVSFVFHWLNSAAAAAEDARLHGEASVPLLAYLGDARFWFESFQNWQSEFLATAVLIVLAIFLRERGSPESKPVGAPHAQTKAE